jgi:metallo-beta-lactamase family protein
MLSDRHHRDPFGFHMLTYVRDVEDSKALNFLQEPAVIISASGMCEAGRILHHLKHNIEERDNTILFVGFQAEHTLGRRIRDGEPRVRIFGEEYDVRARVESIDGYSAHADSAELRAWTGHFDQQRLQRIFLVHGEAEAGLALADALRQDGFQNVEIPERGQTITL